MRAHHRPAWLCDREKACHGPKRCGSIGSGAAFRKSRRVMCNEQERKSAAQHARNNNIERAIATAANHKQREQNRMKCTPHYERSFGHAHKHACAVCTRERNECAEAETTTTTSKNCNHQNMKCENTCILFTGKHAANLNDRPDC